VDTIIPVVPEARYPKTSRLSSLSEPRHDEVDIFRDSNRVEEVVSVRTENQATAYRQLKQAY
jgi:hypothetical protein